MGDNVKSNWDKADIVLKPVGGLLTALAVAGVGFFGSQFLDRRQTIDTNARLYAELMSKREESDSLLRKDMFNSIIGTFLKPESGAYEEKVLKLELLSYNFHEALDLGPLFKDVYKRITSSKDDEAVQYLARLERAARDVTAKQVEALEEGGGKLDGTIDLEDLRQHPEGIKVLEGTLRFRSEGALESDPGLAERAFKVEALYSDLKRREIRVKLEVRTPRQAGAAAHPDVDSVDSVFWVGPFDFPMIDNIRLSHSQRCAIVLRTFQEESAEITLVYFPGSKASLKEKPFYDEVVHDLLSGQRLLDAHGSK